MMDTEESTAIAGSFKILPCSELEPPLSEKKMSTVVDHNVLLQSLRTNSISIIGLPDFLSSVNLKYVKLGYHYLITHAIVLMAIPALLFITLAESWFRIGWADILQLWENLHFNLVRFFGCSFIHL